MNPAPSQKLARVPISTTTPLVVDGRACIWARPMAGWWRWTPPRGKQLWAYQLPGSDQPPLRGLGYWPGDKAHAPAPDLRHRCTGS